MSTSAKSVAAVVRELVAPVARELGYLLWDVEYVKEGTRMILRITIDSTTGISIDDCEKMHRAIDPILDKADPIADPYYLEVSSPGIERELRTEEHIVASIGAKVEVRLFAPQDGSKSFVGKLIGYENGVITLETERGMQTFARAAVSKLKTVFDFGD